MNPITTTAQAATAGKTAASNPANAGYVSVLNNLGNSNGVLGNSTTTNNGYVNSALSGTSSNNNNLSFNSIGTFGTNSNGTPKVSAGSAGSYKGVNITMGSDAEVAAQMKAIDAKNSNPIVSNTPDASSVYSSKGFTLPSSSVDTTSNRLAGYTSGTMQQYGNQQTINDATTATKNTIDYSNQTNTGNNQTNSSDLTNRIAQQYGVDPNAIMSQLATEGQVTSDLNTQYAVPDKIQAAQDAYNNYNSAQLALNQQIEKIRTTPGITTEQAQQQIDEVSKSGNANLANLAVINQAAQGNMSTAMNIVQMKLDQQFKPLQDQIDALGKFVTINNADLTDSQQVQLENQRFVMQNNLDNLMSAKQSAHQFALQQGIQDPNVLNAIDQAQTPADVYAAVGMTSTGQTQGTTDTSGINSQYAGYITSTQDGTQYVKQSKLSNLTTYQQQEAARQYAAAGVPVLTDDEASKIQNINVTKQNLTQLQSVTQNILGSGLQGRTIGAAWNTISQALQLNPDIASFNSYRDTAINTIQALAGGTGSGLRLNQTEIDTAASNIPKITDNLETADAKISLLNSFLDKWTKELLPQSGTSGNSNTGGGLYNW